VTEQARRLSDPEVSERVRTLNGWQVREGQLVKEFRFRDFVGAVGFVNEVAQVAEELNHHPDLLVRWGSVTANLTTHSAGGLTESDFRLASRIDALSVPSPGGGRGTHADQSAQSAELPAATDDATTPHAGPEIAGRKPRSERD
jgi:4a-hydroxytetrahydrobiopterin dehydratase